MPLVGLIGVDEGEVDVPLVGLTGVVYAPVDTTDEEELYEYEGPRLGLPGWEECDEVPFVGRTGVEDG